MNKKASPEDYVKFKELLQFFVKQAGKNADAKKAEIPTMNRSRDDVDENPTFRMHYGLKFGFDKIDCLPSPFIIRFTLNAKSEEFGKEYATYINIFLFNIIGRFNEKHRVLGLQNVIRLDVPPRSPKITITGDIRKRCAEWNEKFEYHTIEELGIDNDNNNAPNEYLKKMLDDYLECYHELYDDVKKNTNA
ncbi:MAG: hypothetical protein LBH25_13165 [Fibromonadaceae bacterium]|nr:hypothetical protein [Fibromonadaceae bacterium]